MYPTLSQIFEFKSFECDPTNRESDLHSEMLPELTTECLNIIWQVKKRGRKAGKDEIEAYLKLGTKALLKRIQFELQKEVRF